VAGTSAPMPPAPAFWAPRSAKRRSDSDRALGQISNPREGFGGLESVSSASRSRGLTLNQAALISPLGEPECSSDRTALSWLSRRQRTQRGEIL